MPAPRDEPLVPFFPGCAWKDVSESEDEERLDCVVGPVRVRLSRYFQSTLKGFQPTDSWQVRLILTHGSTVIFLWGWSTKDQCIERGRFELLRLRDGLVTATSR